MSENKYIIEITGVDGEIKETFDLNRKSNGFKLKSRNKAKEFLIKTLNNSNIQKYKEEDIINLINNLIKYYINIEENNSIEDIIKSILESDLKSKVNIFNDILQQFIDNNRINDIKKLISISMEKRLTTELLYKTINYYLSNNSTIEINEIFKSILNNENIDISFKIVFLIYIFEKYKIEGKLDDIKELNFNILNSNLDNNDKIEFLNNIIKESLNLDFYYLKDILYMNLHCNLVNQKTVEFLQYFINKSFEENKLNDIREIINIIFNGKLNNDFKFEIIFYILNKNLKSNIPNFTDNILDIVLNSNMNNESKVNIVNFIIEQYIHDNKPIQEIIKKLNIKNIGNFKNINNILARAKILEKENKLTDEQKNNKNINIINKYLEVHQKIININTRKINENIEPLENADKNIVSHITDTHGDSLAILGSLKQTGFIGELTGEMLFYNINDKKFYKLEEIINSLINKGIQEIKYEFVVIPDFKLPDKMPEGIFVHTGDIQDRGQESAESFAILRRAMDLYKEKYIEEGLDDEIAKEKLINKIIITTSDHDNYKTSLSNEFQKIRSIKNFNKHHKIQEDMFIDGYINSGRLIQTNNKNLKVLANHSYVDANSVVFVLMAIIFPYNESIYEVIDKYSDIDLNYISNIQNEFKELKKSEKYIETNRIFNKIRANIIKSVLKQEVDLDNIDENIINTACNKFFEKCIEFKYNSNNFFTILRSCIGIPVEGEEFSYKEKLTATEILEAFSMGTAAIDNMNRKKMKEAIDDNRHYNDPIMELITFRNGRTKRGDGFLDSTENGVKAVPIKGLLNDGIVIVNGHDVIQRMDSDLNYENDFEKIRYNANYPNDRAVSYSYNNLGLTYIAPQIFKINENGEIVNGIYNPIEIKRGEIKFGVYCEPNPESKTIENIYSIMKYEINEILGAGTKETVVNIPIKENIIENLENLNNDLNDNQNQNMNNNTINDDFDNLIQNQNTSEDIIIL